MKRWLCVLWIVLLFSFTFLPVQGLLLAQSLQLEKEDNYNIPVTTEMGNDITMAIDGCVYVTGSSNSHFLVLKYDPRRRTNNAVWDIHYSGPLNDDAGLLIAASGNSNIYTTGCSKGVLGKYDFLTLCFRPDGALLWEERYNPFDEDVMPEDMDIDQGSNIFITGSRMGCSVKSDYITVKYDEWGTMIWSDLYDGPINGDDRAAALAVYDRENIIVTGSSEGATNNSDYFTIKYDDIGKKVWTARYNGSKNRNDSASDVAVDNQGNVYVTGACNTNSSSVGGMISLGWGTSDCVTVKYDFNGKLQWAVEYNAVFDNKGQPISEDQGWFIAVDEAANVYVLARSDAAKPSSAMLPFDVVDMVIIKYDTNGKKLWERWFNGTGNGLDDPADLVVKNGFVYVLGSSEYRFSTTKTGYEYVTLVYDSVSGNQLTENHYNVHDQGGVPAAMVVDSYSNEIFITGTSGHNLAGTDTGCGTISYQSP